VTTLSTSDGTSVPPQKERYPQSDWCTTKK